MMPRQVARISIIGCGLVLVALFIAACWRFPLAETYQIRVLTLDAQAAADRGLGPALALASGALALAYIGGYRALSSALRQTTSRSEQRWLALVVLLPPLLAAPLLFLTHPTSSLDLYDYLYRGQIAAFYGANNFVQTPHEFRFVDSLYWHTAWRRATTAYGPLWEALSIAIALWAERDLWRLVIGFKLSSALAWALVGLVLMLTAAPGQRLLSGYLWLWNPLVLWELLGAGHNDGWIALGGLLALWLLPRRPLLALGCVVAGALIKYPLGLIWPVLLCAALARQPTWAARGRLAGAALGSAALMVALAYWPWWEGAATFAQWHARGELFTNSPLALLRTLWLAHAERELVELWLNRLSLGLVALGVGAASWAAWRTPEHADRCAAALLGWFVVVASPWMQPWYLIWPMALLMRRPRQVRPRVIFALVALGGLLIYPAYSALRPWLGWPGDSIAWQVLILMLLYLAPSATLIYRLLRPQWALALVRTASQEPYREVQA